MSLIGLLTVNRSFGSVRNKPSSFRMRGPLRPRFGGANDAPRIAPAATRPGSVRPLAQLTLPCDATWDAAGVDTGVADPSGVSSVPDGGIAHEAHEETPDWTGSLPPWGRRSMTDPRQAELSLDSVRVVRNDLADADLELISRPAARESAAWQRALVRHGKALPPKWKWWTWRWQRSERANA